jgi:hypothetical protein
LFVAYASSEFLRAGTVTAGRPIEELCEDHGKGPVLSQDKITACISTIRTHLTVRFGHERVESVWNKFDRALPPDPRIGMRFLSGKTYLIRYLYHHIKRAGDWRGTLDQFKVRLANDTDLSVCCALVAAVTAASRS